MKGPEFLKEAEAIWKNVRTADDTPAAQLNVDIHKKLLNIFHAGDFYYYIFNLRTMSFDFISPEIKGVLGYEPGEMNIPLFLSSIHPDDHGFFLKFETEISKFFHNLDPAFIPDYKVRSDYRVKRKDGTYVRLLQQLINLEWGPEGTFHRIFGVHTDITDIKKEGKPVLSFIGLNGQPSFIDVKIQEEHVAGMDLLSEREMQVLILLAQGKNSRAIAEELFISKETVDKHRKNILAKTNTRNTAELITFSLKNGWL
jgi:DNA-binding CsgD family transcriptional regulator